MSQARYALYEGVAGHLVAMPGAPELDAGRRFAGMKRKVGAKMPARGGLSDMYEPIKQVIICDPALAKAVRNGELKLLAGPVEAGGPNEARELIRAMESKAAPKVAKQDEKAGEKSGGGSK